MSLEWLKIELSNFYPRGASDGRVIAIIVCLCVSHAGIVSKRLNVGSRKQLHVIAQGIYFSDAKIRWWRNLRSKWPPPFQTAQFRPIFAHSASTVRDGKKVQLALIGSRPRAFQRAIDEPCTLPLTSPKGGTKRDFAIFSSKFQLLSKKVCCKVSSCENFQRQSCGYIILSLLTNHS